MINYNNRELGASPEADFKFPNEALEVEQELKIDESKDGTESTNFEDLGDHNEKAENEIAARQEYIPGVSSENIVDQEFVNSYNPESPLLKVGHVGLKDSKTGEVKNLSVVFKRETDSETRIEIMDENSLSSEVGFLKINEVKGSDYDSEAMQVRTRVVDAEQRYLGKLSDESKVFIEYLSSKFYYTEDMHGNRTKHDFRHTYEGVGRALYQLAVERSLQIGAEGRVQGQSAWRSFPAHEAVGFVADDVFETETGQLHHTGESLHEDLAVKRLELANLAKKSGAVDSSNPKAIEQYIRENLEPNSLAEQDYAYFSLPPEGVDRFREVISERPIFEANAATIDRCIEKKKDFGKLREIKMAFKLPEDLAAIGQEGVIEILDKSLALNGEYLILGDLYEKFGQKENAELLFSAALKYCEQEGTLSAIENSDGEGYDPSAMESFAELLEKNGFDLRAKTMLEKASAVAVRKGQLEEGVAYLMKADKSDETRSRILYGRDY